MGHVTIMFIAIDVILSSPADDTIHQEILSTMFIGIANHFYKDALLHEIDIRRYLCSIINSRFLGNIRNQAVLSCLNDHILAMSFFTGRIIYHSDIGIGVLVETQQLAKIHIVDKTTAGQQDIALGTVLEEIQIVIEILQITLTVHIFLLRCRKIKQTIMVASQIPIFTRTQMI